MNPLCSRALEVKRGIKGRPVICLILQLTLNQSNCLPFTDINSGQKDERFQSKPCFSEISEVQETSSAVM
jgi:hypothetical protein